MMLRVDDYRLAFVHLDGLNTLVGVLSGRINFQIQYQLSFCLWVLTFNSSIAEKMNKFGVILVLADILTDAQKEKVSRIILAVFRVRKQVSVAMIFCSLSVAIHDVWQKFIDETKTCRIAAYHHHFLT